ncbi:MAG: tail fiber domain-containing protein [Chitinophagaceae bacterium]|nr:tail fiber domain-containing protein [Chitinophagaceae bacterium]
MKKLLIILSLLATFHVNAQVLNSPSGTVGFSSPNVGIGTTSTVSNYGVHMRGGIGNPIPSGLYIQRGDIPASNQDCALGIGFSSNLFSAVSIGGGSCAFQLFPSANTPAPDMAFSTNTVAPQLLIRNNGNVGIGTATPVQLLDVNGTTKTKRFIMTNGAVNGYILQSNGSGLGTWVNPSSLVLAETDPKVGTLTTNKIPKWGGTTLVDSKIAEVGTSIGVGTSTPATNYGVHISGGVSRPLGVGIYVERADLIPSNQDCALAVGFSSSSFTSVGIGGGSCAFRLFPSVNTPSPDMAFSCNQTAPQLIIKNNGSVGIGTAIPGALLEVAGGDALINTLTVGKGGSALPSNTALGFQALSLNTSGYNNVATGYQAMYLNTTGYRNVANGYLALTANTIGNFNTATGYTALYYNADGTGNSAHGAGALFSATNGSYNTAMGNLALYSNSGGSFLTGLGSNADVAGANLSNATAIGFGALVNNSDKIRFGNAAVTVIEGNVIYTVSDGRFKTNITEDVKGLDFINKLRPVQYNFEAKEFDEFLSRNSPQQTKDLLSKMDYSNAQKARYDGFIAQEVEAAAKEVGYQFNGVHVPENENDNYSLAYSEFVVPLVKSVQELSKQNDDLKTQLATMQTQIDALINGTKSPIDLKSTTGSVSKPILNQIAPNPFSQSAIISFALPADVKDAELLITDLSGKILKSYSLIAGATQQVINGNELSAGTYLYSVSIKGKVIDSKQMVVTH